MPFSYSYKAYFVFNEFDIALLSKVIPTAETLFNGLSRKKGHEKRITVNINSEQKCLDIILQSDIALEPINYLRTAQYFSKLLSEQLRMNGYDIKGKLLLRQK